MSQQNKDSDQKNTYLNERIRQAKLSFNLLVGAKVISGIVALIGAGLLMSHKLPKGAVTTAVGLAASNITFVNLYKDANDRLDKAIR